MGGDIDWSATGDMLAGIGSILGALAIIGAAYFGSQTFKAWRQQKLAERKALTAERILTATHKVRRHLKRVRDPIMLGSERDQALETLRENADFKKMAAPEADLVVTTQAYYNRINAARDVRDELEDCYPMAAALFGSDVERALERLHHMFWRVKVYVDSNRRGSNSKEHQGKIDAAIYEGYPSAEANEFDVEIAQHVTLIESVCLPALRLEA